MALKDIKVVIPEAIKREYNDSLTVMPPGKNTLIGNEEQLRDLEASLYNPDPIVMLKAREGAGKTALVEQFIYNRANTDVPVIVIQLNLEKLGELGSDVVVSRIRTLLTNMRKIEAATQAANPTQAFDMALFIDEIHKLNNYGVANKGNQGSSGAMNALKEETSRGKFPLIGATTLYEYDNNIKKDPAFARRFSVITVQEPDAKANVAILQRRLASEREQGRFTPELSDADAYDIVNYANSYIYNQANPAKCLYILNKCIGLCRYNHVNDAMQGMWITHDVIKAAFLSMNIDIDAQKDGIKLVIPPQIQEAYNHSLIQLPMGNNSLIGYKNQLEQLDAAMLNVENQTALLLGEPGIGKTALVEQWIYNRAQTSRKVAVVSLEIEKLGELPENVMIARLRSLLTDLNRVKQATLEGNPHLQFDMVLFVDEIHKLNAYGATSNNEGSSAAMNALKEGLARGAFAMIGATTDYEYRQNIVQDQAFDRRMGKVAMEQPTLEQVEVIIKRRLQIDNSMLPFDIVISERNLKDLIGYADSFIRNQANPAKTLAIFDKCTGFCRQKFLYGNGNEGNEEITHEIIRKAFDSEGYAIDATTTPQHVEDVVKSQVIGQPLARHELAEVVKTSLYMKRNFDRPLMTAFFVGSTGVGKAISDDEQILTYQKEKGLVWKDNGELKVGDYVLNRHGKPVQITGVFPQGMQHAYRVILRDGRSLVCNDQHLWSYVLGSNKSKRKGKNHIWDTATLRTMMDSGLQFEHHTHGKISRPYRFFIPTNEEIQDEYVRHKLSPYVLGALLGDGCLTEKTLEISSDDSFVIDKTAKLLKANAIKQSSTNYSWSFKRPTDKIRIKARDVLKEMPGLIGAKSINKYIPESYKHGTISQRWQLVNGLFDTDGCVNKNGKRYRIQYSSVSKQLIDDLREVLQSLGFSSRIVIGHREGTGHYKHAEYTLNVIARSEDKAKFFTLPRKRDAALEAIKIDKREPRTDLVPIVKVEDLHCELPMTCIMVDDPEHLYLAGKDMIVTHNTQTAKALAQAFFGRRDAMVMINCGDYATKESAIEAQHYIGDHVQINKRQLILLDEIEKADIAVMDTFMRMIDDGIARDSHNIDRSLNSTIIVATSNLGANIFAQLADNMHLSRQQDPDVLKSTLIEEWMSREQTVRHALQSGDEGLNNGIKPEFLERFSLFVPFLPLARKTIAMIARAQLEYFVKQMKDNGRFSINIQLPAKQSHAYWQQLMGEYTEYGDDDPVSVMIAQDVIGPNAKDNGARSITRYIDQHVKTAVVDVLDERVRHNLPIDGAFRLEAKNASFESNNRKMAGVKVVYIPIENL